MYQLYHRKLPQTFYASFSKLTEIHNHNTRNTKLLAYFIPRINETFVKIVFRIEVLYYGVK